LNASTPAPKDATQEILHRLSDLHDVSVRQLRGHNRYGLLLKREMTPIDKLQWITLKPIGPMVVLVNFF
jgi:hypothetical protein